MNQMNLIWNAFADSEICVRLAQTLGHFLWQGAAIAAAICAAEPVMRKWSSAARYRALVWALSILALCPAVTLLALGGHRVVGAAAPKLEPGRIARIGGQTSIDAMPAWPEAPQFIPAASARPIEAVRPSGMARFAPALTLGYLLGVIAMLARLALAIQGGRRLRRMSMPVEGQVLVTIRRLSVELGLRAVPPIARCAKLMTPVVIGALRPMILLPLALASELSPAQIEAILAHELAHIRRHDHLVNLMQGVIEALLFFHPAVWFISSRIRIERELCCDDLVIELGATETEYAMGLLRIAQSARAGAPRLGIAATGRPSRLYRRVTRLLGGGTAPPPRGPAAFSLTLGLIVAIVLPVLAMYVHRARADDAPQPVDAAALVREALAGESWLDQAKSMHVRFRATWTDPAQAIASQPVVGRPGAEKPGFGETIEWAFDDHRLYLRHESPGSPQLENIRYWDGKQLVDYERYVNHEVYGLDKEPFAHLGRDFLGYFSWPREGVHHLWWDPTGVNFLDVGDPTDYALGGRERYHGVDCYRLDNDSTWCTLYVGAADHRLYGRILRAIPRSSARSKVLAAEQQVAKNFGAQVNPGREFNQWVGSLPAPRRRQALSEYHRLLKDSAQPYQMHWCGDYRQVGPGRWYPATQGYEIWQQTIGQPPAAGQVRQLSLASIDVDQPLPDNLFHMEFHEGVQVNDLGHDPRLVYKYKKNMTPREWDDIISRATALKGEALARQERAAALIGKPAPALPPGEWINSKPLTWVQLKGKVVVMDFWAEWCAPCRNDLPLMVAAHQEDADKGIVVIGMHPPGSDNRDILRVMQQFHINYPVCVDTAVEGGPDNWGAFFGKFAVTGLPQGYLVDRTGTIVAHGPVADMLARARVLAGS